jgi:hypothetical protein
MRWLDVSGIAAERMKSKWDAKRKTERTAWRCREDAARRGLPRVGCCLDPLSGWSSRGGLLEAFVDTLAEPRQGSPCDETLASMVSGLLDGTGCAVVPSDVESPRATVAVATGTWQTDDLGGVLSDAGCDWIRTLQAEPMLAVRSRRGVGLRALRRIARPSGTAVVFPFGHEADRRGAFMVSYDSYKTYSPSYFAAGKLLVAAFASELTIDRLEARLRKEGDRVSRLRSDVERLGLLLRRLPKEEGDSSGGVA